MRMRRNGALGIKKWRFLENSTSDTLIQTTNVQDVVYLLEILF
jgi:hypothetical protein